MTVRIIASDKNWIEGSAVDQLNNTALLAGVVDAAGMPDLHPGKDAPIGAVFATDIYIYPHLVDGDIGCGICLWQLNLRAGRQSISKMERRLGQDLEGPWTGDLSDYLEKEGVDPSKFDEKSMGTIGFGNHFAEISGVHQIFEEERFRELKLDKNKLCLLVHSGSRGLGEKILRDHTEKYGKKGLLDYTDPAKSYLAAHNAAMNWAKANRKLIARRFIDALGAKGEAIIDCSHNHVVPANINGEKRWLHRKGAVPTDRGPVVIAGSRGTLSYIVEGTGEQSQNLLSAAHGAGRKWKRSDCKARLENKYTAAELLRTEIGSKVICDDKSLLFEEAPEAYKDIEIVIQDLIDAKLIRKIASLAPVLTYKRRTSKR